jgi:hypothetical protein
MKERRRQYREEGPLESLLFREKLGFQRYRKTRKRDEEKKRLLIDLWLKTIEEREKSDYIRIGPKRRRLT